MANDFINSDDMRAAIALSEQGDRPAGDFSAWLRDMRRALRDGQETNVPCGDCNACCASSYQIHINPEERETLRLIRRDLLVPALRMPKGHMIMPNDTQGRCPKLVNARCTIYQHRPQTCRIFDCRLFAAVGIPAGGDDKAPVNQRITRWKFSYPTPLDVEQHLAVRAAAAFMRERSECFPGGRVPKNPSHFAIVAIKAHEVFLKSTGHAGEPSGASDTEIAQAIIEACRKFDELALEEV